MSNDSMRLLLNETVETHKDGSLEYWRDVANSDGLYRVSNKLRVRSMPRKIWIRKQFTRIVKGGILKPGIGSVGYREVRIKINGKGILKLLHRLIAEAFIPNPENKPEVNHKDGNKLNNEIENLEWVTHSEQRQHAYDTGLQIGAIGSKSHTSVLTEEDIPTIRKRLIEGDSQSEIARDYGVHTSIIHGIVDVQH